MNILNNNESNQNIVRNITLSTIEKIKLLVNSHLHESGFHHHDQNGNHDGNIMLVDFGTDDNDDLIIHENNELDLCIEGFTDDGIITDSFMCIAVLKYEDMHFEQTAWALGIALRYFGEETK